MGLFRKIAALFGIAKDDETDGVDHHQPTPFRTARETDLPRKGFGVPVQVVVDRPLLPPVLSPCPSCDGGVQGLKWYAKRLRIDEDGDVADEFLDEVSPQTSQHNDINNNNNKTVTRFKLRYSTIPAKVEAQVLSHGKLMHRVQHQGSLQWV